MQFAFFGVQQIGGDNTPVPRYLLVCTEEEKITMSAWIHARRKIISLLSQLDLSKPD